MKIFVINLQRSPDRLANIEAQLSALKLPFTRIEAIDGKLLGVKDSCIDPYRFRLNQGRECRAGEVGCAESHRKAWKEALKHNEPYSLILEDDAVMPPNLPQVLQSIETNLKLDIINLSSTGSYAINQNNLTQLKNAGINSRPYFNQKKNWKKIEAGRWKIFNLLSAEDLTICECSMMPHAMVAYVVTPKACRALLAATQKISYPIDYAYRHTVGKIRQGFSFPVYIPHDSDVPSNIGDRSMKIRLDPKARLIRFFRRKRSYLRRLSLLLTYGIKSVF